MDHDHNSSLFTKHLLCLDDCKTILAMRSVVWPGVNFLGLIMIVHLVFFPTLPSKMSSRGLVPPVCTDSSIPPSLQRAVGAGVMEMLLYWFVTCRWTPTRTALTTVDGPPWPRKRRSKSTCRRRCRDKSWNYGYIIFQTTLCNEVLIISSALNSSSTRLLDCLPTFFPPHQSREGAPSIRNKQVQDIPASGAKTNDEDLSSDACLLYNIMSLTRLCTLNNLYVPLLTRVYTQ